VGSFGLPYWDNKQLNRQFVLAAPIGLVSFSLLCAYLGGVGFVIFALGLVVLVARLRQANKPSHQGKRILNDEGLL